MHTKKPFALFLAALIFFLLTFAACEASQAQQSAPTPTPQPRITPLARMPTKTPVQPTATVSTPPLSAIRLVTDKANYSIHDPITVMVTNGTTQSLYSTHPASSCSIIQLELQIHNTWIPQGRCVGIQATPILQIPAGQTIQQVLRPENAFGPTHATMRTSWPTGTYRAIFNYSKDADPDMVGGTNSVSSSMFMIK